MCGIVGYIGSDRAQDVLLTGLKRLEYRGYDSAGITTISSKSMKTVKKPGKLTNLLKATKSDPSTYKTGIGHTRWATHGEPNQTNAHPHVSGKIAIVHNGIIENYQSIRQYLISEGEKFESETDSEVIAALISFHYKKTKNFVKATRAALNELEGTFGLVVACKDQPKRLIAARRGSPLLIGRNGDEIFIASDHAALAGRCNKAFVLDDDEYAVCMPGSIKIYDFSKQEKQAKSMNVPNEFSSISKGQFEHFMLKEIMEQPQTSADALAGRLNKPGATAHLGGLNLNDKQIGKFNRIQIVACGTAFYAGLTAKYIVEQLSGIAVDVEVASEFRYRSAILDKNTLGVAVSQSGETADTLAAVEELQNRGVHTLGLVNVVGSSIARNVDGGIYLHAGPEIAVASTKAFTNQVISLILLGLHLGRKRGLSAELGKEVISALKNLPTQIELVLNQHALIQKKANEWALYDNALYLGRDSLYPIAMEGALKLKEISYIHAEGAAAGEMKHGTLALVNKDFLCVYLLGDGALKDKSKSNLEEINARGGSVILMGEDKDADIHIPASNKWVQPILFNVANQLLAYEIAKARKTNVDQPRNLAKSVTVE